MHRTVTILVLIAVVVGLLTSAYALSSHRRLAERLNRVEQSLGEQREADNVRDEARRQDNRSFALLLRAAESPWVGEEGVPVRCRLTVEADVLRPSEPVLLLAELRNASDREQTVAGMFVEPFTLTLAHDGREARYVGPQVSMPPPMPVTLPPGRIVRQTTTLGPGDFAELASSGSFAVEWTYVSEATNSQELTWTGRLPPAKAQWRFP